jgi:3-methyladenine DNA glycosylase AlkD
MADPEKARVLARFFKTGPGQYGEGDRFLGVTVPAQRRVARIHRDLSFDETARLLRSPFHEDRLTGLIIVVNRFRAGDERIRQSCHRFYLKHLNRVNNWDLVDVTAPDLVGAALAGRSLALLVRLARSRNLWHRRVAMVATFHFTRAGDAGPALRLARRLLGDDHDLMHKAVGWMLREVGKRASLPALERFLARNAPRMPRTALRYAIERFPEPRRRAYLRPLPILVRGAKKR